MAFFFSAVATQGNRNRKSRATKVKDRVEDEDSEESNDKTVTSSQVTSTNNQDWIAKHCSILDKKKFSPAVV